MLYKKEKKKQQQTEDGRKKQTNTNLELKTQEVKLALLSIPVCIYEWLSWELNENPIQQLKILNHLVIAFTAPCFRSRLTGPTFWALNVWPSTSESHSQLTTSESHSCFTNVLPPSSDLADFRGHISLCGFRAKIDKERFSRHSGAASKMPEIIPPLWPPIYEHTQKPTPIHPYIYIYIYIYIHTH